MRNSIQNGNQQIDYQKNYFQKQNMSLEGFYDSNLFHNNT